MPYTWASKLAHGHLRLARCVGFCEVCVLRSVEPRLEPPSFEIPSSCVETLTVFGELRYNHCHWYCCFVPFSVCSLLLMLERETDTATLSRMGSLRFTMSGLMFVAYQKFVMTKRLVIPVQVNRTIRNMINNRGAKLTLVLIGRQVVKLKSETWVPPLVETETARIRRTAASIVV